MASVIRKINEYNAGLPTPLHELKWNALRESPFRFFRGTCHVFAQDFVKTYKYSKPKVKSWISGDMHLENFGAFKGENGLVYFDINDFDESVLAGPKTDICRFLSSVIVAAADMKVAALGLHKTLHDIMVAYVTTIVEGKALMLESEVAHGVFKQYFEHLRNFDREAFIAKRTEKHKGVLMLKPDDVHLKQLDDSRKSQILEGLSPLLNQPRFNHLVFEDAAFRIAGTGSLGLQRFAVLCFSKRKGKRYLLDVKEARRSAWSDLIKNKQPGFRNEADRINATGNIMQFNSPAYIANANIADQWFVVKHLQLLDDRIAVGVLKSDFGTLSAVAHEMAVLIGYAHLRSSGHLGSSTADDLKRFAEKKQWQRDIVELSAALARKNAKYYREFTKEE